MTKFNWFFTAAVATIFLFLYVPIMILIIFSFNDGLFPAPWIGFSLGGISNFSHLQRCGQPLLIL